MAQLQLACPFDALGSVHTLLAAHAVEKLGESFDEHGARLHVELPAERVDDLKTRLRDATRDMVRWLDAGG